MPATYQYVENEQALIDALIEMQTVRPENAPLCIDLEWDSHDVRKPVSLLQYSTAVTGPCVVDDHQLKRRQPAIDCLTLRPNVRLQTLGEMISSSTLVTVLHDATQDAVVLGNRRVAIGRCFDTSVAHFVLTGELQKSLDHVLQRWLGVVIDPELGRIMKRRMRQQHFWTSRPLDAKSLEYAACDVRHLPRLYATLMQEATRRGAVDEIYRLSAFPRPKAAAEKLATAIAFGLLLKADLALRERCGDKTGFASAFGEWKDAEAAACRRRRGNHSDILQHLKQMRPSKLRQNGLLRMSVEDRVIAFHDVDADASDRAANVAYAAARVQEERARIEADKGGVELSACTFAETVPLSTEVTRQLVARNVGVAPVELVSVKLLKQRAASNAHSTNFALREPLAPLGPIAPGGVRTITLACQPRSAGMLRDILSINFSSFSIGRYLEARAGDAAMLDLLKPKAPFQPRSKKLRREPEHQLEIEPAPREASGGADAPDIAQRQGPRLLFYNIDPSWSRQLRPGGDGSAVLEEGNEHMRTLLASKDEHSALTHYRAHFARLLWAEEEQLHADLTEFDFVQSGRGRARLEYRGGMHWLSVPGLAENRPSVLRGDKVRARLPDDPGNRRSEGVAMAIERERIGLRFGAGFNSRYVAGVAIDVWFVLPRMGMRLFHQGLENATKRTDGQSQLRASILFPEPADIASGLLASPRNLVPHPLFDRTLNAEQVASVRNMCGGSARRVPYLLFGPPGTGKTTTLVEAVLQMATKLNPSAPPYNRFRILVVTPTNTAADFICKKLTGRLNKAQMLRLVAYSRARSAVLESGGQRVVDCSNWDAGENAFVMPGLDALAKPCVLVATLTMASKLYNQGVPRGHFDVICIDEGGQAVEPEAIGPVAGLLGASGQLIVAGDPRQLGPVIHHALAKEHGLGMSYLERLMERPIYAPAVGTDGRLHYDQRVITKLLDNYRSHALLLALPNRLFYDNELRPRADPMLVDCCLRWEGLPNPSAPILFDGLVGKNEREESSPSWFNNDEAVQVLAHVKDLLRTRRLPIRPEDIGVITPYNKQVDRIRKALRAEDEFDLRDIKVGSTELFQGQERKVIIISTVRSSTDHLQLSFDKRHHLGFLDNPKRFNVAITRAMALLIVVGNPHVLALDEHWRALIKYCVDHHAYRGEPPPSLEGDGGGGGNGVLAGDAEELLRPGPADEVEASERMQEEGMEMPVHE